MKTYEVELTGTIEVCAIVIVTASDPDRARELAKDFADDAAWSPDEETPDLCTVSAGLVVLAGRNAKPDITDTCEEADA